MTKPVRALAIGLWIVLASLMLTHWWLTRPDFFPPFPKPAAEFLVKLSGAENAEEVANLELLLGLAMSVPLVSALTFGAWLVWRRLKPTRLK